MPLIAGLLVLFSSAQIRTAALPAPAGEKRAITVDDTIAMTRVVGGNEYVTFASPLHGSVAHFSPDVKQFFFVLAKGNLSGQVNEFSLVLYHTADSFNSPKPDVLVQMSSSSNRDAIRSLRWLPDNDTIVFLGENPHEESQVYAYHVKAHRLEKLTNCPTSVVGYDISEDGHSLVFEAEPVAHKTGDQSREVVVVRGQRLDDLLGGTYDLDSGPQIYVQEVGHPAVAVPTLQENYRVEYFHSSRISPDGRYALFSAVVRNVPEKWKEYQDKTLRTYFSKTPIPGVTLPASSPYVYFIFDKKTSSLRIVVDAPSDRAMWQDVRWKPDSSAVFLKSYLPLDVPDAEERAARQKQPFRVSVELESLKIQEVTDSEWPKDTNKRETPQISVVMEEDLNRPPKIYVTDLKMQRKASLMDLNPQFADLEFGKVELVEWITGSYSMIGGLYLPPDWTPGKRYPLVIQTHGFRFNEFSMDGLEEWGSAYAARPMAAKGIIVLQFEDWKDGEQEDHFNDKGEFGSPIMLAQKKSGLADLERAIDYLDKRGMIDRNRLGIAGFSVTVSHVAYALTHSKYHFAAASLVDGFDAGYFQEIAYPDAGAYQADEVNGGVSPFGHGLGAWLRESPSFSLGNVNTPVWLLGLRPSGTLEQWEWYAGLALQKKPVELTFLVDNGSPVYNSNHLLTKPWERKAAQEGMIDWFRFWLKGEEDPDPAKVDQYRRWRELRKLHEASQAAKHPN